MMALIQFGGVSGAEEEGKLAAWGVECVLPSSIRPTLPLYWSKYICKMHLLLAGDVEGSKAAAGKAAAAQAPSPLPFV